MIADTLTVMWKERKGLSRVGGSRWRTAFAMLTPVVFFGVVFPLIQGEEWFSTAFSLILSIIVPFALVAMTVCESFAGERERHTLSTLLASRLPDKAILFGKLGLTVAYGWITTLVLLAVSVLTANLAIGDGQFHFLPPILAAADILISLFVAIAISLLGILISLRAATVQGATQALMVAILVPGLILQIAPIILMSVVPDGDRIISQILDAPFEQVALVIGGFFAVLSVGLFFAVLGRFQRAKLILS